MCWDERCISLFPYCYIATSISVGSKTSQTVSSRKKTTNEEVDLPVSFPFTMLMERTC